MGVKNYVYLCIVINQLNLCIMNEFNLITEETEIEYTNLNQLNYEWKGDNLVELYIDSFYTGDCQVWFDAEMDERPYIILNYEMIHLDCIKIFN